MKERMLKNKIANDPWTRVRTRNGFSADEIISSFQKAVRRNMVEESCEFAYELYISSPELEEKLWRRILTISVEDIGMGDSVAAVLVNNLNQMRKEYTYGDGDRPIYFIHAIRYLCGCEKDRSSDLLKNIIIKGFAMGKVPEVMDVGLDKHTARGMEMGRDSFHFLTEGSIVIPEKKVDNNYKERYMKMLEEYKPEEAVQTAFEFNKWQY